MLYISTSLENSIESVIVSARDEFVKTIRPRHTYYTSILKLYVETTPSISSNIVDYSEPS